MAGGGRAKHIQRGGTPTHATAMGETVVVVVMMTVDDRAGRKRREKRERERKEGKKKGNRNKGKENGLIVRRCAVIKRVRTKWEAVCDLCLIFCVAIKSV